MRNPFMKRRKAPARAASRRFAAMADEPRQLPEKDDDDMADGFHVPYGKLSKKTRLMHYAIASLMEELEAVDWYAQRADDTEDEELREILLHNMREEVEHAMMTLEWLRRNDSTFHNQMAEYLSTKGNILEQEEEAMGRPSD